MKYHNINGVQVELKKARTKSELITGNYAGIVKGEQSQQMSNNYQNMNYGQVNIICFVLFLFIVYCYFKCFSLTINKMVRCMDNKDMVMVNKWDMVNKVLINKVNLHKIQLMDMDVSNIPFFI